MSAYYNEIDKDKAEWLREVIKAGIVAPGDVDERSISDVQPGDVRGYTQCHWFAGVGVWSYALRLAGWPDDRPVWTGSCPCPSFSCAGKGTGFDDPRHLWPDWARLIRECRPPEIFGEQSDDAIGYGWLDLVQTDLERENYAVGKAVLGAASVGAPHIRQRLYFGAHAEFGRLQQHDASIGPVFKSSAVRATGLGSYPTDARCHDSREHGSGSPLFAARPEQCSGIGDSSDSERDGRRADLTRGEAQGRTADGRDRATGEYHNASPDGCEVREPLHRGDDGKRSGEGCELEFGSDTAQRGLPMCGSASRDAGHPSLTDEAIGGNNPIGTRLEGHGGHAREWRGPGWLDPITARSIAASGATRGFWGDCDWWYGRDGKYRPIGPGLFPLAHGAAARVLRLRGFGDAINPWVAKAFIESFGEACQ